MSDNPGTGRARRFAAVVEYDGSGFCGWQKQQGVPTVQQAVETALARVADHPVTTVCAGRTDTGVHAVGQVIHFDSAAGRSSRNWIRGVNSNLPAGVSLAALEPVDGSFHARFSARRRHYRYIIFNRPVAPGCWRHQVTWIYRPLDGAVMGRAAAALAGTHNFSAFRSSACQASSPVRTIHEIAVRHSGAWIWIDIEADGFLHHMVRNIAGALIAIGAGEQPPDWLTKVLETRDRRQGAVTAPPAGLYLCRVRYDDRFRVAAPLAPPVFW